MQIADQLLSYANAIFTIDSNKETQAKYYKQIAALDAMNSTNADFARVLSERFIDKDERKELAKTVLTEYGFDPIVIYWVWTIIDNNAYDKFHFIALICKNIYYNIFDIVRVKIVSASALDENQITKIKTFLTNKLQKQIDVEWEIKPNLIGGLQIHLNNKTYTNTFKSKLVNLKRELMSRKENYGN